MSAKKGPPPIVYIAGSLVLAGLGYVAFNKLNNPSVPIGNNPDRQPNLQAPVAFVAPTTLPAGIVIRVGGSTSMVQLNKALKTGFEQKFPGINVSTLASSSSKGLADLAAGTIEIAGISRQLTAVDRAQGLVAVPIIQDKIAIVVGQNNAFNTGLTSQQVAKIFTGEIRNWSEVGSKSLAIRPILRPSGSGTHQSFQELALQEKNFGAGGNFKVLERDATTPLLQALGTDGIGYATYNQVANQQTVRVVAIDGTTPELTGYPYQRTLAYAYKNPPNDAAKAFLGFATSSQGRAVIDRQSQTK